MKLNQSSTSMTNRTLKVISSDKPKNWQEILSELITDPKELLELLRLDINKKPESLIGLKQFPLKVPRPFVDAISPGNWSDPLLRQVWPSIEEDVISEGFSSDPLQESNFNPVPGLLHLSLIHI